MSNIGILGTGDVGQALGRGFHALGHDVMLGSRELHHPKAEAWAKALHDRAGTGTFADAARFGEILVLATLGVATEEAIRSAGVEHFAGKLVLDATNPLDTSVRPTRIIGGLGSSAGERHQRVIPDAHVVKVFNTVGHELMFRPELAGGPPDMFFCGDDDNAKRRVAEICTDFGWNPVDCGDIGASHYLEAMCLVWVLAGIHFGSWRHAFKLLR